MMCGVEILARVHEHTFHELYDMLDEWIEVYVENEAYHDMLYMHQCQLLGESGFFGGFGRFGDYSTTQLPAPAAVAQRQLKAMIANGCHRGEAIWSWGWWEVAWRHDDGTAVGAQLRKMRAKQILRVLKDNGVLGMDALTFDHMAKWLQLDKNWETDIHWLCLEGFSPPLGGGPAPGLATWARFGADEWVDADPRTGGPGLDWNIMNPRLTMHQDVNPQRLGSEKVVLMRDCHFRLVRLCTTLRGHEMEAQPPRENIPRGRKPGRVVEGRAVWDFVQATWREVLVDGYRDDYEPVFSMQSMLEYAAEVEVHYGLTRVVCFGRAHLMYGWGSTAIDGLPEGAICVDLTIEGASSGVVVETKVEVEAEQDSWVCVRCQHMVSTTDQFQMLDGALEMSNFCTMCAGPVHCYITCRQCPTGSTCSHFINECRSHSRMICLDCLDVLGGYGSVRYDTMVALIRMQVDESECEGQLVLYP